MTAGPSVLWDWLPLRKNSAAAFWGARKKYSKLIGKHITGFTREVRDILFRYDWPGNIRELENVVEYAVTMETGSLIGLESLPVNFRDSKDGAPPVRSLKEQCDEAEKKSSWIVCACRDLH